MIPLDDINLMTQEEFVAAFRDIAEDSPWVAAEAARRRPFADREATVQAFLTAVTEADADRKLALLYAHPDLAGRAAVSGDLGESSKAEQAGAGLDRLDEEEAARLSSLNAAYRRRFGFPFILAVKGASKADIFAGFASRIDNDPETEFDGAIEQVCRIIRFRLESRVSG